MLRLRSRLFRRYLIIGLILVAAAWLWNSRATIQYPNAMVFSQDNQYSQNFGAAVAVDQETIVASAPGDRSTNKPGSAYIYALFDSAWRLDATLRSDEFSRGIYNGFSESISLNNNTIVTVSELVGLKGFYVPQNGTDWSQVKPMTFSFNAVQNQQSSKKLLLEAVAAEADTLVVGARNAAYVFTRTAPNTWTYEAELTLPQPQNLEATDRYCTLGSSVAISGDTIVIGSKSRWGPRYCANVFVRHPQTRQWVHQALLLPKHCRNLNTCNDLEGFGYAVAIEGDRIVVGTAAKLPGPVQYCNGSGGDAAYIFERNQQTGNWQQTAVLRPRGLWQQFYATRCGFGEAVAVASDRVLISGVGVGTEPHLFRRNANTGQWQYEATLSVDRSKIRASGRYDSDRSVGLSRQFAVVGDARLYEKKSPNRIGAFSVFELK